MRNLKRDLKGKNSKEGSDVSLETLLKANHNRLYRYCLEITRDQSLASDIMQETLLKAFKNFHSLKEKNSFGPWLRIIAQREYFTYRRLKKNQVKESLDFIPEIAEKTGNIELKLSLKSVIEMLDTKDKELLTLCDLLGYSYEEASQMLNLDFQSLRWKIRIARKNLLDLLKIHGSNIKEVEYFLSKNS